MLPHGPAGSGPGSGTEGERESDTYGPQPPSAGPECPEAKLAQEKHHGRRGSHHRAPLDDLERAVHACGVGRVASELGTGHEGNGQEGLTQRVGRVRLAADRLLPGGRPQLGALEAEGAMPDDLLSHGIDPERVHFLADRTRHLDAEDDHEHRGKQTEGTPVSSPQMARTTDSSDRVGRVRRGSRW